MTVDSVQPIICPVCFQNTFIKDRRVVPHLSGLRRGYCEGTGLAISPAQVLALQEIHRIDYDDELPTEDE